MKLKNIAYAFFILLAVGLICNSIFGNGSSAQKTSNYTDNCMTFSYPTTWQFIRSNSPGIAMFNDSGTTVTVCAKEQLGDGNNTFEEIENNAEEDGTYPVNYTIDGTNLTYYVFSNVSYLSTSNLIKKGDNFFSVAYMGNVDRKDIELILKTIN